MSASLPAGHARITIEAPALNDEEKIVKYGVIVNIAAGSSSDLPPTETYEASGLVAQTLDRHFKNSPAFEPVHDEPATVPSVEGQA